MTYLPDGAVVVVFPSNLTIALESGGHPVLENQHRMHFKRKIIAPKNKLVHRLEWRFYLRRKGRATDSKLKLGQRLRVGELFTRHDSMLGPHDTGGYKEKALLVCELYHPSLLQMAPPCICFKEFTCYKHTCIHVDGNFPVNILISLFCSYLMKRYT